MPLTSLNLRNSTWMDGVQVSAQDLRLQQSGAFLTGASPSGSTGIAARPGLRYGTGDGLKISASSGMTLAVNAGVAWVQGSAAANAGMYEGVLDTAGTVALATSDPTNPRIDNIIVQFTDVGTSSSTAIVTPQTGTPASSPVAPTLPANSLLLAQVAVGAGVSSITSGNITDKRAWTAATGGIVPMSNVTGGITGAAGLYAHDLSSGRLKVSDGSGNARAPKTAAFTPVSSAASGVVSANPGATSTIASVSFSADGVTEVRFEGTVGGIYQATPHAGDQGALILQLDGVTLTGGYYLVTSPGASTAAWTSGVYTAYATPSSGSHTATFVLNNNAASANAINIAFNAGGDRNATLRVGPSFS